MLAGAVASGKVAHAYLFVGPVGVGKRDAARAFGRLASCHRPAERQGVLGPCGACPSCERPFAPDRHHDLMVVDPAEKESRVAVEGPGSGKETPLIDRLRHAQEFVAIRPVLAPVKCLILLGMDALQDVHMNAILKTIEEPPAHAMVLLTAANASSVLPTILSRCQRVDLSPAPPERILAAMGRDDDAARLAALLSGGRPAVARRLMNAEDLDTMVEGLADLRQLAMAGDPLSALHAAERCRRLCLQWYDLLHDEETEGASVSDEERVRQSIEAVLFPLEAGIRDAYAQSMGAPVAPLLDLGDKPSPSASSRAATALGRIGQAKRAIRGNANTRLALEALFLGI
jgi:hypothetical protein